MVVKLIVAVLEL